MIWIITHLGVFLFGIILARRFQTRRSRLRNLPSSGTFVRLRTPPHRDLGKNLKEKRDSLSETFSQKVKTANDDELLDLYDRIMGEKDDSDN